MDVAFPCDDASWHGRSRQTWCEDWQIDSLDQSGRRCLCSPHGGQARFSHFGKLFVGPTDSPAFESFSLQVAVGLQVQHPAICTPTGGTLESDLPIVVFPRFQALTLTEWLDDSCGGQPATARIAVAVQIVSGLEAAHKLGFVHRAVGCEHVLILPSGQVKLIGWGNCLTVGALQRLDPAVVGRVDCGLQLAVRPPEAWLPEHEVSSAQDIYQAAHLLRDLLGPNFMASKLADSLQSLEPNDRPTAAELLGLLGELSSVVGNSSELGPGVQRRCA